LFSNKQKENKQTNKKQMLEKKGVEKKIRFYLNLMHLLLSRGFFKKRTKKEWKKK